MATSSSLGDGFASYVAYYAAWNKAKLQPAKRREAVLEAVSGVRANFLLDRQRELEALLRDAAGDYRRAAEGVQYEMERSFVIEILQLTPPPPPGRHQPIAYHQSGFSPIPPADDDHISLGGDSGLESRGQTPAPVTASSERPIQVVAPGEMGDSGDEGTRFGAANTVASGDGRRARQKQAARARKAAAAAAPKPPAVPRRISSANKVPLARRGSGGGARDVPGPSRSLGPQPLANFCWRCQQAKDLVKRAGGAFATMNEALNRADEARDRMGQYLAQARDLFEPAPGVSPPSGRLFGFGRTGPGPF